MLGRQNGRYIRGGVASARVTGIIHPGTRTHICARIYTFYRSDSDKGERFTGPRSASAATGEPRARHSVPAVPSGQSIFNEHDECVAPR